jgi:hypothetical protein
LETRNALEADEAGVGGDVLKTGDALGIGDVLEARGEADFDFGDGGFGDPIGGKEQRLDSFDSDSFDAKLELTCACESACSCDDSMPLISGDSSALGKADFDFGFGDDGFKDPIGGEEQKFGSFDSDSFDAKLELTCAYESACSCDDSMPLISGDSPAFTRSGTSGEGW